MNSYNLYIKVEVVPREGYNVKDFKEIRISGNDGSEIIVNDFQVELEPLFFVAEGLLDNREHLVSEELKPLFIEKKEELRDNLYQYISNYSTDLADNIINDFKEDINNG